ncbi:methyltransferase [Morganella morganii]|uniref:Methyltransferase n=1 Tax=Morganella morganii TaxID=582 RepID=A0A8I0Q4M0_MORMO|nr:rRNA adenine N-6-methyltransferase family protein [Morganella morganii]MBE8614834.1 methyltransferase [Morganella morganii]
MNYICQFFQSPRTFGSLVPSSRWLCNRMVELANWEGVVTVAELGAGDGVLTRRLLDKLALDAELDAYEIQTDLVCKLQILATRDARLNVISQSAEKLHRNYDIIFSCLPLSSIPTRVCIRILRQIRERLVSGGSLILFQYTSLTEKLLSRYFDCTKIYEVRNFPPAWIYVCTSRSVR